ncbi:MAG: dNTP triphosphohydrolase [Rhodobacteraceae bacterium]|nr:dNTP triphosphohydrolase [Paracoccaceae bacterium]
MSDWQFGSAELKPYACMRPRPDSRRFPLPESRQRMPFQRDCDRIVHSHAFRQLMHKTQVFLASTGGQHRTRLTHTIEVARVARSLAIALGLNPDLAEAVALAHDLGHTPFGHVGEVTLAGLMQDHGGFDHNSQAVRIVTQLERSYIEFDGLNLTWETLEGIAKHNGPIKGRVPEILLNYTDSHDLELTTWPSAEAQVAALADDIAYFCHDLQDGLRAGLFHRDEIKELPIIRELYRSISRSHPDADSHRIDQTVLRQVFGEFATDVIKTSSANLDARVSSVEEVRRAGERLVRFSGNCFQRMQVIRSFLDQRMYKAKEVQEQCDRGREAIEVIFRHRSADDHLVRTVADGVAGLTDGAALEECERIKAL